MAERKYVPTIAQLIDRLCIVTLKSIKIPENKESYEQEAQEIIYDLNNLLDAKHIGSILGDLIRAVQVDCIANETIWQNESKARQ